MKKPSTLIRVLQQVENWPEVFSLKAGFGSRELSLVALRNGLKLVCRRSSRDWDVVRDLFLTGGYLNSITYLRGVSREAAVLDLGGNIGCFSLLAATQNPLLQITSYEPGPPNIRMFKLNCLANLQVAGRISLYEEAVGGTTRQAEWHFDEVNPGGSSIYGRNRGGQLVQIRSFAEVVHSIDLSIALAKIDIEGAEYELLEQTPAEVWQKIPALTIEVHKDPQGKTTSDQMLYSFRTLGYHVERDDRYAWFCYR